MSTHKIESQTSYPSKPFRILKLEQMEWMASWPQSSTYMGTGFKEECLVQGWGNGRWTWAFDEECYICDQPILSTEPAMFYDDGKFYYHYQCYDEEFLYSNCNNGYLYGEPGFPLPCECVECLKRNEETGYEP